MKNVQRGWAAVARMGGIGDNLIAGSVLRPLKKLGYMTEMITAEPNHVLFQHNPFLDKLSVKKKGDIPEGGEPWQEWFRGRANEYDIFANLSHSGETMHAFFPSQTQFWWRPEMRRRLAGGSYLESTHDIVGVPHEFGPLYFASEEEQQRARVTKAKMGDKVVGWVLSGSRLDKMHPHAPLVVSRIIKELGLPVMTVGAPNERQHNMARTIQEVVKLHNGTTDGLYTAMTVTGSEPGSGMDWPIRRSLAQLMACDLVITPDTGMAWAVAFEQMPKILMVSHASAENIGKHWVNTTVLQADQYRVPCHPCHRLHNSPATCVVSQDGNASACMDDISVECLLMATRAALGSEDARERLNTEWASNVAKVGNGQQRAAAA